MDEQTGHVAPDVVPTNPKGLGKDGQLYLPNPHPLVDNPAEGSWGHKMNSAWRAVNFFFRGFYGTAVEWGVSGMDLALEYPKVALAFVIFAGVVGEESMSQYPMLHGTMQYMMFALDPEAAKYIFPPEASPSEADQIVQKMAAGLLKEGAEYYYASPEYKQLELELQAQMHQEVLSAINHLSGITIQEPAKESKTGKAPTPQPVEPPAETPSDAPG